MTTAAIGFAPKLYKLGRNPGPSLCSSPQIEKGQIKAGILTFTALPMGYAGLPFAHKG